MSGESSETGEGVFASEERGFVVAEGVIHCGLQSEGGRSRR